MQCKIFLVMALLAATLTLAAQTTEWVWARSGGGGSTDLAQAVAVDPAGNTYVAGYFNQSASFGTTTLTSSGANDIFVAKLSPSGAWLWAIKAGGANNDTAYDITADNLGNVYVVGSYKGQASFGTTLLSASVSYSNLFAAKLDSGGNWLWAKSGGGSQDDCAYGVALDAAANVYIGGYFQGSAWFGTLSKISAGGRDAFAAKLDSAGNWLCAVRAGGSGTDTVSDLGVDPAGNLFLGGNFTGTADFGTQSLESAGNSDIFAARLDAAGNWVWSVRGGGTNNDACEGIAVDGQSVWLTGTFYTEATFGASNITGLGNSDVYAAKLDAGGNWLWAAAGGSTLLDASYAIAADGQGNVWLTGLFNGSASFGNFALDSGGSQKLFAARLDPNGAWTWAGGGSGTDTSCGYSLCADGSGDIRLCGSFSSSLSFGDYTLSSLGMQDVFALRFRVIDQVLPLAPQGVTLSRAGNDLRLDWEPVTQNNYGQPLTPEFYRIYYRPDAPGGTFSYLGQSVGTSFTHSAAGSLPRGFYLVTAVWGE